MAESGRWWELTPDKRVADAKEVCVGRQGCFTWEIPFLFFSAVSLLVNSSTSLQLCMFVFFVTLPTFINAPEEDAALCMKVKITLNISNYSLFT